MLLKDALSKVCKHEFRKHNNRQRQPAFKFRLNKLSVVDTALELLEFLSRNYRLIVAPFKFDVPKTQTSEASSKDASLKNSKFPRSNYQTDSSETETLCCFYCSPLNFLPKKSR